MPPIATIEGLAIAWQNAGGQPARAPSARNATSCCVTACGGLAFAEIRTADGVQALCWKHFEAVSAERSPH